jgi:hypothetical protein
MALLSYIKVPGIGFQALSALLKALNSDQRAGERVNYEQVNRRMGKPVTWKGKAEVSESDRHWGGGRGGMAQMAGFDDFSRVPKGFTAEDAEGEEAIGEQVSGGD